MKNIFLVVPGSKMYNIIDPPLTSKGKRQAELMKESNILPSTPSLVICGTGLNQFQTAEILGLIPDKLSNICGTSNTLEIISDEMKIFTGSGRYPLEKFLISDPRYFLQTVPNKAVIITDLLLLIGLNLQDLQTGAIYQYSIEDDVKEFSLKMLFSAQI
jgi:hypothetical protein